MTDRAHRIRELEEAVGSRRVMWFGTRGTDAQPLLHLDQFEGVVGLISPLGVTSWRDGAESYLEQISGHRPDLNTYAIDEDESPAIRELHRRLVDQLRAGTIVVAYRSTGFLASAVYPRLEQALYLGLFHGHQEAFEHKPWVETMLSEAGVRTIPWRYFGDGDERVLREWVEGRNSVLRANYSDGGVGLTRRVADATEMSMPDHRDGFIAAAPFLDPAVPLNVSGCVFPDGAVIARAPSLQLIGVPACTSRQFGYCGNDFSSVLPVMGEKAVRDLEHVVKVTGRWLGSHGYRGAFGLDALYYDGEVYLTEVNPRFQGSSAAGAKMQAESGMLDVYLDHISAWLGLDALQDVSLVEQAQEQARPLRRLAQVVCYSCDGPRRARAGVVVPDIAAGDVKGVPDGGLRVESEAMLFKLFVRDAVTRSGYDVPEPISQAIADLKSRLFETEQEREAQDDDSDAA